MNEHDLETLIDRRLKALPGRRAPASLLPAVMAAVRLAAARPWYARPWASWPAGWKAASVVALVVLVAGLAVLAPLAEPLVQPVATWAGDLLAPAGRVVMAVDTFSTAMEITSRVVGQSVVGLIVALFVVMLTTSVVVGAAISRVALGGAYR